MTALRPHRRRLRAGAALALLGAVAVVGAVKPAGATRRLEEKGINLDIARRVQARLAAEGVPVVMTRTSDQTVSLASRVALANLRRVDAFVAIHNNSSRDHSARGTQVYRQIAGGDSARLGEALRARLASSPGLPTTLHARRGDHGDYYYVLRHTTMPAVIVEGAFVSNRTDARLLADPAFRQRLADSIAAGILDYQRTLTARPLPSTVTPVRVAVPGLGAPTRAAGAAVNARTVDLSWDARSLALSYHVYRDGTLIGTVDAAAPDAGRLSFTDLWAAPGQTYTYEIASAVSARSAALESAPAAVVVRTPPMVVALDPGHGGSDPGAIGSY